MALTCVADIARTNENRFVEKIMAVFQRLFNYIHGPLDRELKICILACFGDLTLSLKKHSESYVESIIEISNSCFEAVEKFSSKSCLM